MEAGIGTLLRLHPGHVDVVLVVAEPSVKSIEVARRAVKIASSRARVVVVANKVRDALDLQTIRDALNGAELVAVPHDDVIAQADAEGRAPVDMDDASPGVSVILGLADRLLQPGRPPEK